MVVEHWWNDTERGKLKNSKGKNLSQCYFATNPTRTGRGLNPDLHSKQPVNGSATVIMKWKGYRNQYGPIFRYCLSEQTVENHSKLTRESGCPANTETHKGLTIKLGPSHCSVVRGWSHELTYTNQSVNNHQSFVTQSVLCANAYIKIFLKQSSPCIQASIYEKKNTHWHPAWQPPYLNWPGKDGHGDGALHPVLMGCSHKNIWASCWPSTCIYWQG